MDFTYNSEPEIPGEPDKLQCAVCGYQQFSSSIKRAPLVCKICGETLIMRNDNLGEKRMSKIKNLMAMVEEMADDFDEQSIADLLDVMNSAFPDGDVEISDIAFGDDNSVQISLTQDAELDPDTIAEIADIFGSDYSLVTVEGNQITVLAPEDGTAEGIGAFESFTFTESEDGVLVKGATLKAMAEALTQVAESDMGAGKQVRITRLGKTVTITKRKMSADEKRKRSIAAKKAAKSMSKSERAMRALKAMKTKKRFYK